MVKSRRITPCRPIQFVARVRDSAEKINGGRIRGTGRGECRSNKFIAGGFDISGVLIPFCSSVDCNPVWIGGGENVESDAIVHLTLNV